MTDFHGWTFEVEKDGPRLTRQLDKVREFMLTGGWHTLAQIAAAAGGSEAACSARLRDLRRPENGGYTVDRKRGEHPYEGLHFYRVQASGQRSIFA